ncbi:MAG TPA: alpha/beta hydrolase [Blastocatellia bacterium]|nr:alpha/beta hydrolase [Blastocatellia bacterium]
MKEVTSRKGANEPLPLVTIVESPLAPDISPVEIHYRESGSGKPLVFLHGGWGYEIYPFDRQVEAFGDRFRILIPDRTGYGRSMRLTHVPIDFHARAAVETVGLLDALHIERPVLWGHSDGAVIAAKIGLTEQDRISGLILEAFHFYRVKPGSREFFSVMADDPGLLGERVVGTLSQEHGEDYWHTLIVMNGKAWLGIADEAANSEDDLYDGKLSELRVPALFIHGSRDPRTEPGEMDAVRVQLPSARIEIIEGGGHSPHSESASASKSNQVASEFLEAIR